MYPAISYNRFSDTLITSNRRVNGLINGTRYLLPKAVDPGPWNVRVGEPTVGGILKQNKRFVLINARRDSSTIPRGIFAGTWSPHNWFHWTIDTLPAVFVSRLLPPEFDEYPLILADTTLKHESWREPLDLVRGKRQVISISSDRYWKVSDLIWLDNPSNPGPLPLDQTPWPNFRMHGSAMQSYRSFMLEATGLEAKARAPFRKVFLARKQQGNRPYNQNELTQVADEFGFEPVFLEELNFRQSIEVMVDAEFIIGPHGAGWANCLYARPGTRAIMWTWPRSVRDNWFANVASVAGLNFSTIFTDGSDREPFNLNPLVLRQLLQLELGGS
ncbi:glycosyltransferase family 61 protein [Pontimonas sp.]|nr:glycosyltransferase family 61 protein [Pontimonas sp.]